MDKLQYDFIDIYSLTEDEVSHAISMMSERKRQRVMRLAKEDDRLRSAAAEHLARKMLAERFRISPSVIRLEQTENGQPVAENLPCFVSLSHSGRWAMCALYEHPVGADIEELSSRGQKLTSRICTDKEREYIYSSGDFDSTAEPISPS